MCGESTTPLFLFRCGTWSKRSSISRIGGIVGALMCAYFTFFFFYIFFLHFLPLPLGRHMWAVWINEQLRLIAFDKMPLKNVKQTEVPVTCVPVSECPTLCENCLWKMPTFCVGRLRSTARWDHKMGALNAKIIAIISSFSNVICNFSALNVKPIQIFKDVNVIFPMDLFICTVLCKIHIMLFSIIPERLGRFSLDNFNHLFCV